MGVACGVNSDLVVLDVVAVGRGKEDAPLMVQVGDKVIYGEYSGKEIKIEGTKFVIMRESEIYAILK